jgi:hypothetical protein
MLHEVNSQHAFNPNRPTTAVFGLRIMRVDHSAQLFPGNDLFHSSQKLFFSRCLFILGECSFGYCGLTHAGIYQLNNNPIISNFEF